MSETSGHVEVPVKVNAWVDAGVKDLVEALSAFPHVCTVESCEGPPAQVIFYVQSEPGCTHSAQLIVEPKHYPAIVGWLRCVQPEIRAQAFDEAAVKCENQAAHYDKCRDMVSDQDSIDYYESQAAVAANLGRDLRALAATERSA